MRIRTHRDLDIWTESIELVVEIYKTLERFPREERYGLADQIKRSSVSIPSKKEFMHFLYIALGSAGLIRYLKGKRNGNG